MTCGSRYMVTVACYSPHCLTRGLLCHRRMRRCSVVMTTVAALPLHSSYRQPTCSSPTAVCLPFWLPPVMYLLLCS